MQKIFKKKWNLLVIITLIISSCTNKIAEDSSVVEKNVEIVENVETEGLIDDTESETVQINSENETILREIPKLNEPLARSNVNLLHTAISITLYDRGDERLLDECFELIERYENLISSSEEKKDTSEIYKLNNANGKKVTLSDDVLDCLKYGIEYSSISKGMFDVTIGKLSTLWGFSSNKEIISKPSDEAILESIKTIDYNNIIIEGNEVYLKDPSAKVDLGGVAKGFIADRVADYLRANGVETALLNLGGNVLTVGIKEGNKPFKIGVRKPEIGSDEQIGIIEAFDKSVVSSGAYEKNFTDQDSGEMYFHILDPNTGYPVITDVDQVTIISKLSVTGDGLSTTVFSLGSEEGLKLVESIDEVETIIVKKDGTIITSSGIGEETKFTEK